MGSYIIDSKHPRGFARWERARKNAEAKPNSPGAKLYAKRTHNAQVVEKAMGDSTTNQVFDFMRYEWSGLEPGVVEFRACSPYCAAMELQLITSDIFTDQQLIDTLMDARRDVPFRYGYRSQVKMRAHVPSAQKRNVKCHVCHALITPNGYVWPEGTDPDAGEAFTTVDLHKGCVPRTDYETLEAEVASLREQVARMGAMAARVAPAEALKDLYVIDADGYFIEVLDFPVVHLDEEKRAILNDYCHPDGRTDYLNDFGGSLRQAV